MPKTSSGLLLCRRRETAEFLLVHPGGPYFRKKDAGIWSIPKGLVDDGEDLLEAAKREFSEETGFSCEADHFEPLGTAKQSNKLVHAWAFVGDADVDTLESNLFEMEWPPRSGKKASFPEVDRASFFDAEIAAEKIIAAQAALIDRALRWMNSVHPAG
ncbi:MAG: NUDIX domain-containing protein [Myxococcota bacterium]